MINRGQISRVGEESPDSTNALKRQDGKVPGHAIRGCGSIHAPPGLGHQVRRRQGCTGKV
jgi:hypothetical protein